ncbi:zinc finger BED domain-containing protein 4-like [Macrobrachium rosenbergii]|uniref:zinc finger BED domain-containing protein 4-like n=1 Tax=Macrobrachium rosenbergii TaxID=79674 RepID=UPI0034D53AD7
MNEKVNQYNYLELMCDILPDAFEDTGATCFQQDGARAHTAKSVTQWLQDCEVPFINDWPGNSPDISPIENLWEIVKRDLQDKDVSSVPKLEAEIRASWNNIPKEMLHNLALSVPKRLKEYKHTLQKLAIDEEAKKGLEKSAKDTLLSEVFWDKIAGYLQLLKPVATAITMIEGDDQYLSIVMVFHDLQSSFDEQLPNSPVLQSEESLLKEVVSKRREWLVQKVHLAANLLDPRYRGCHISDEEAVDAIESAYEVALRMPSIDEKKVLGEIAEFRAKEKLFSKLFIWQSVDQCSPTSWWNGMCSHTQLSKVATGILNLPPTNASVERSFSRHSHIHSSDRNRLSTDRAAKLVYVARHLTLDEKLHQTSTPRPSTLADAPLSQKEKPSSSRCSSASSLKENLHSRIILQKTRKKI